VFFRFGSRTDLHDATREVANVDQGGLGMPDRDYYLKTDAKSLELKQKYEAHAGLSHSFTPEHSRSLMTLAGNVPQPIPTG